MNSLLLKMIRLSSLCEICWWPINRLKAKAAWKWDSSSWHLLLSPTRRFFFYQQHLRIFHRRLDPWASATHHSQLISQNLKFPSPPPPLKTWESSKATRGGKEGRIQTWCCQRCGVDHQAARCLSCLALLSLLPNSLSSSVSGMREGSLDVASGPRTFASFAYRGVCEVRESIRWTPRWE